MPGSLAAVITGAQLRTPRCRASRFPLPLDPARLHALATSNPWTTQSRPHAIWGRGARAAAGHPRYRKAMA